MFNTNILDLIIGLVFIFTLYSLLASSIMEILSGIIGMRSKMLEAAIINLFESKSYLNKNFFKRFLGFFWVLDRKKLIAGKTPDTFSELFFKSARIVSFNRYNSKKGPSYMSSNVFSENLIHLLSAGNLGSKFSKINTVIHSTPAQIQAQLNVNIDKDLLTILQSFLESAEGDVEKFRKKIEEWYDELMQRISGWYKRQSRYIILGIGLILAVILNVDTIKICEILSTNSKARVELVNSAVNMASTYEIKNKDISDSVSKNKIDSLFNKTVKLMNTEISETNNYLALGWNNQELSNLNSVGNWLFKLAGLIITALAISLGSDFWFNMLKKLLQLKPALEKKIQ